MTLPQAARDARDLFAATIGGEPAGVWSAPGRVNLIGEHTDYNDGFVLPFAIDRRTYAAATRSAEPRIRVASTLEAETVEVRLDELALVFPDRREAVPEWARYPLGVAWALLPERDGDLPGVDLAIASDVPVGAGLSSSAALECAVAAALDEMWRLGHDRVALARAGRLAENEAVGAPTGIMDQMAAMLGRADSAVFLDCRSLEAEAVDLGFREQGLEVLVIDTGVTHAHATGGYRERRATCEHGAAVMGVTALRDLSGDDLTRAAATLDDVSLRRVRHVVTENRRVLDTVEALRTHGPGAIGDLLLASHASMRDDFEISIPELDTAVETAVAAGAIGARMTGGGFGGAAIALVPSESSKDVTSAVTAAFAASGFAAPRCFTVTPSDGARREG